MSEEYLWDRSGEPDPEVRRLEETLAPLRYRHRPGLAGASPPGARVAWAAPASVVLAAAAAWQFAAPPAPPTGWRVASVEGDARLGGRAAALSMPVRAGQVLRTGAASEVTIQADDLGRVDLGPDSELRAAGSRRVALARGQLHAFIWAPPRQFVLDTPSARAVDLGCEYTITVDPSGDGLLRVATGWVAFQFAGRESFIPAGAQCATRRREGPGVPYFQDAPESLRAALPACERGDAAALREVLSAARPRDGLTLWHLLTRAGDASRPAVFDRFAQLIALPADVSREAVLRRDPRAIDLCWNALGLENTDWWRGWERRW
jgi:hypothetical protein